MIWAVMVLYQFFVFWADLLYLYLRCVFLLFVSIYNIFYPRRMKSVVGELILDWRPGAAKFNLRDVRKCVPWLHRGNAPVLQEWITVITQAGSGIGKELALQFARLGAKIVCWDIDEQNNKKTLAQIKEEGGTAYGFVCDVSDRQKVKNVSEKIRESIGDVTILVNCASRMLSKPLLRHSSEEIEALFKYNALSCFWTVLEWLPSFKKSGRGHIVSVASIYGLTGTPNLVPYCSSKFAVNGFMEAVTEELRYGNQNPSIKTTVIHPFLIKSTDAISPRVRFPKFSRVVTPEDGAHVIIQSIRREEEVAFVPQHLHFWQKIFAVLPVKMQHAIYDFLDTGVDIVNEKQNKLC